MVTALWVALGAAVGVGVGILAGIYVCWLIVDETIKNWDKLH